MHLDVSVGLQQKRFGFGIENKRVVAEEHVFVVLEKKKIHSLI
jgi:hypothetical protein